MKIGINTLVDLDVPFDDLLHMIRDSGFTHISLSHDVSHASYHLAEGRDHIARILTETELGLDYIHMPLENFYDLSSPEPQVRSITVEVVKMALYASAQLGGSCVVVHACGRDNIEESGLAEAAENAMASLRELGDYADQLGVSVVVENLAANTIAQRVTLRVMHDPSMADIPLCIDPCHASIENPEALDLVRFMAPRVVATHFSDTMGTHDSHLIPGEGEVDYSGVARELARVDYDGVVDLECSLWMQRKRKAAGQTHPGDTVPCSTEHYLEKAAGAARSIWENIERYKRED